MTAREFNVDTLRDQSQNWTVQDAKDGGDVANYSFFGVESPWGMIAPAGSLFTNNANFEVRHQSSPSDISPNQTIQFNPGSTFVNSKYFYFPGTGTAELSGDFHNEGVFNFSRNLLEGNEYGANPLSLIIGFGSSTFNNSGKMYVGDKNPQDMQMSPIVEVRGGFKNTGDLYLYPNGFMDAVSGSIDNLTGGSIYGSGNLEGNITHDGGHFYPGSSAGGFRIDGNMSVKNDSILGIELGGDSHYDFHRTDTEHDFIEITGDLIINGGNLDVSLIDGFELDLNQQFDIVKVDGELTGTYEGLEEGAIVGSFDSVYGQIPMNLFITYEGGDGNDIALYTSDNLFGLSNI